jgi:membrane-associated phospholipid phosphatase
LGPDHAGGADRIVCRIDGGLYQAVTGAPKVRVGGILGSIVLLLAGSVWAARAYCGQQEPAAKSKQDTAQPSNNRPENNKAAKTESSGDADNSQQAASTGFRRGFKGLTKDFLGDQKQIWTSPARLRFSDSIWLVPAGGFAATLFVTDSEFSKHLSHNPSTISHYKTISDAGVGALIGGAGGMWLLGHVKHNEHWSETGFLAGEAALNSLVAVEGLKYTLRRERPFQSDGSGPFFQGGTSFPSEHAAAAWAIAGVIAHEYPGPFPKIVAYGLATLVDLSRVKARQHFPSDVFIGSTIGNLIAQDIYSRHHDPELGGSEWKSIGEIVRDDLESRPRLPGSPYVPLESWVYPAIERLAAQGLIDTAFLGTRPWTRTECALLVQAAGDRVADDKFAMSETQRIYQSLSEEFASDLNALEHGGEDTARLESLYTRSTQIIGQSVNDSYHFGQTIINNYGRPYQQGFNTVDGFSAWAAEGRFVVYVRGEYQHAPAAPGFSQSIENLIGSLDQNPARPAAAISATNQFRLLDTYVSTSLVGWDFAFGKQSLWWGQGEGGALLMSNNAEPIYMFRASRVVPISLPWIFRYLGPMKIDAFMGQLADNQFPPRPLLHGETISFKPTRNVEFSFTRLAEMGGVGRAVTAAAIFNSYFSPRESNFYASNANPGKRTAGFSFSYRVPFFRDWLTLYTDSISPDDVSPVSAPRRAAVNPGIYLSHFPKLPKLDLRIEGVNTNTPSSSRNGHFVYFDDFYHDLSTNKNNIIGSWIGREGQGFQGWSTYWFSARSSLQFGYRRAKIAPDFIPRGETFNDASVQLSFWVRKDFNIVASTQYENWIAPVLSPAAQTNWTSTIGINFQPKGLSLPFHASRKDQDPGPQQQDPANKGLKQ